MYWMNLREFVNLINCKSSGGLGNGTFVIFFPSINEGNDIE